MMSELANDLLDAIASGNQDQMKSAFTNAMTNKINDSLQARKIEIAQRIYGNPVQDVSVTDDASSEIDTTVVTSDNGTEEV